MGPELEFSKRLHSDKYCGKGESFREAMDRIANRLKDNDKHYYALRQILLPQRFLPAGRIQASVGQAKKVTALNCYVSGIIEDNFTGRKGIMQRATEAAKTMRMGGGIGYDFSTLRPRGDLIRSLQSRASGPVSFMAIYDAICKTIASSGHRRGAQMGVLRIDHPDVEEFIFSKQNDIALKGFNISLAVTDEFMRAVRARRDFDLLWEGRVYKTIDASLLWEQIMRSTWDWADPGVLYIDRINKMNNLWYCEQIAATNPCGEQPLPPYGACLLGSFNLVKYIDIRGEDKDFHLHHRVFNWERFKEDIPYIARAMDNVIDRTIYPLKEQEAEAKAKRRLGIGIAGLANAGEVLGYPYGSESFLMFQRKVQKTLTENLYRASSELAKEKGSFPLYDEEKYLAGNFIKTLSKKTREMIKRNGIRNSHLTSIAPTGTISLCADNISSGIEPVWSYSYDRPIIEFEGTKMERVEDYGYRVFGIKGKLATECTAQDHLRVLIEASRHVDSAVSKTCNVDPMMPWEDFQSLYMEAWKNGCKGCTTFNPNGKRGSLLNTGDDGEACYIDPATGERTCE